MPDMWNVAEPLEVEYRQPVCQSSDQSNSSRKEKSNTAAKRYRIKSQGLGGVITLSYIYRVIQQTHTTFE